MTGFEYAYFLGRQFRLTDFVSDIHRGNRESHQLIGLAIDADKRWGDLAVGGFEFYDLTKIAGLFQHILVLLAEGVAVKLLREIGLLTDEVRHDLDAAVRCFTER